MAGLRVRQDGPGRMLEVSGTDRQVETDRVKVHVPRRKSTAAICVGRAKGIQAMWM